MAHNPIHRVTSAGAALYAVPTDSMPADATTPVTLTEDLEVDATEHTGAKMVALTTGSLTFSVENQVNVLPTNEEGDVESISTTVATFTFTGLTIMDPDTILKLLPGAKVQDTSTMINVHGPGKNLGPDEDHGMILVVEQEDEEPWVAILYKVVLTGPWSADVAAGSQGQSQFTATGKIVRSRAKDDRVYRYYRLKPS